jgi:peptidyl-prolyl cis-trans isomerase SurA
MKKFVLSLIALCFLAVPVLAQQDTVVEEIVARVNNSIITRADLRRNQEQTAQEPKEQGLTKTPIEERQANSLRDLIDQQLLLQKAAELGISADADLVKRLDDLRKEMKATSMEDLQKLAESQGVSWEEFKQNTKNSILTQKVIGSEVGSHIQITQDELQKFYDEHKSEISQPERVRLSEILIANDPNAPKGTAVEPTSEQVAAAQAKASEIYQQLQAGAKFDELAHKESSGATADQGGDLGYFKRNDLAKELEDKSFALKAGEFTQPIRTRQGFIILRVNDRVEAGTPPLDRIRDQIQEQIYGQRVQPALREYLTKLREEAYIDIKPGFIDSGASPNQTKLIYAADSGPQTKQVRGALGVGKKKTIVVVGKDKNDHSEPTGSTSGLGLAKAEVDAKQKAIDDRKAAEDAAVAKAAADAAEKVKLSHMSHKERSKYLAQKKREAKKEAKLHRGEQQEAKLQPEVKKDRPEKKDKWGKADKWDKTDKWDKAEKKDLPAANGSTSGRGPAKAGVPANEKAVSDHKPPQDAAAELAMLNHMTRKQRADYLAKKKQDAKEAKKQAKLRPGEKLKQKEPAKKEAKKEAEPKVAESTAAKQGKKSGKKSAKAAPADTSQQADAKKKKSISWF